MTRPWSKLSRMFCLEIGTFFFFPLSFISYLHGITSRYTRSKTKTIGACFVYKLLNPQTIDTEICFLILVFCRPGTSRAVLLWTPSDLYALYFLTVDTSWATHFLQISNPHTHYAKSYPPKPFLLHCCFIRPNPVFLNACPPHLANLKSLSWKLCRYS